jgi:quercetin dioxygenase-like cupin family protein
MPDPSIVRYGDLVGHDDLFIDNFIGYRRTNYMIIGPNIGWEDKRRKPPVEAQGFCVGRLRLPPGGAAALHDHGTTEIFMPIDGPLVFFWGDQGENEETVAANDVIMFPTGTWRGFRNEIDRDVELLAMIGGNDAGRATFHPRILAEAKEAGYELDEEGFRTAEAWEER